MITFQNMSRSEYKDIKRLVKEAWFDNYPFPNSVLDIYASYYLFHYLSESDYRFVAKDNNSVVGFIFGKGKKPNLFTFIYYKIRIFFLFFISLFNKYGRRGIKITLKTNKVNRNLKKELRDYKYGELCLFIVDSNYRGQRIGSRLEELFCEYLLSININRLYLFTDSYSDFNYYLKKGYKIVASKEVLFNVIYEDEASKYYVFTKKIGE